jgi:hypothetical protein
VLHRWSTGQHRGGDRAQPRRDQDRDWIIDLGPEGGDRRRTLIACGTPEQIATHPDSHTGHFLRPLLGEIRSAAG